MVNAVPDLSLRSQRMTHVRGPPEPAEALALGCLVAGSETECCSMPYPRWLAKINKRVFNPREIRRGKSPVVMHVGRSSGRVYQTPLDAHSTKRGYVLVVRYGPGSDWVRNILAAGTATLRVAREEHRLESPRLVAQEEAVDELVPGFEPDPAFFKAEHYLLMDHSS